MFAHLFVSEAKHVRVVWERWSKVIPEGSQRSFARLLPSARQNVTICQFGVTFDTATLALCMAAAASGVVVFIKNYVDGVIARHDSNHMAVIGG